MLRYLDWTLYANPLRGWLLALLVAAAAFAALRLLAAILLRSLKRISARTTTGLDDILTEVVRGTRGWFLVAVALFAGSLMLVLPARVERVLEHAVVLVLLAQLAVWGRVTVRTYVNRYTARNLEADAASVTTVRALGFLATVALVSVLVLMGLANLGIDITALVAGLGIGGVAIALAVQNVLGDLFASLSIVLDKPFVHGDFIVVDDLAGTVEHVGMKTTRLRSLSGEQLVLSNSDLLQSRIRNYKRMQERRVVASIAVVYRTPPATLERIPGILREAVEAQPEVRFDRAHLKSLGASSLDFELVYFVLAPEFELHMERQQAILLEVFRRFGDEGIEFAFPTQTLVLERAGDGSVAAREPALSTRRRA